MTTSIKLNLPCISSSSSSCSSSSSSSAASFPTERVAHISKRASESSRRHKTVYEAIDDVKKENEAYKSQNRALMAKVVEQKKEIKWLKDALKGVIAQNRSDACVSRARRALIVSPSDKVK